MILSSSFHQKRGFTQKNHQSKVSFLKKLGIAVNFAKVKKKIKKIE